MANEVFANGREIACKAGSGKTIAAFPDTCFTPPENPATPPVFLFLIQIRVKLLIQQREVRKS